MCKVQEGGLWTFSRRRLASTLKAAASSDTCQLRQVLITAGEVDMPARACTMTDAITNVLHMPKAREVCAALGIDFTPQDKMYLNQYAVDALS